MTRVLSLFITTVWTPVVLAIINIIQATLKCFYDHDDDDEGHDANIPYL